MLIVLLYILGYLVLGYGYFRLWLRVSPPVFKYHWGEYAWTTKLLFDTVTVGAAFWLSLGLWPFWILAAVAIYGYAYTIKWFSYLIPARYRQAP